MRKFIRKLRLPKLLSEKENRALAIICILGVLFRFFLMFEFPNMCCSSDEYLYVHLANHIIHDGQFIYTRQDEPSLWANIVYGLKPPFYPYVLAFFFKIFGLASPLVKVIQIMLAVVTGVLLFKTGRELFSSKTGLIACALFMFFWEVAYMSQAFLSENLQWFLMSVLLYLVLIAKSKYKYIYIGVVIGLHVLLRPPEILFLLPVASLLLWKSFTLQNIKKLFVIVLVTVIILSPWIIRNYFVYHQLVPVYTDGGINIWMGNNLEAGGGYQLPQNNAKETPVLRAKGSSKELERDRFYYNSAFIFMEQNPVKTIGLAISKLSLAFNAWRPAMVNTATTTYPHGVFSFPQSDALNNAFTDMIAYEFVGLQILALIALIRTFAKKKVTKPFVFLLSILALQVLSIMVSHSEPRYVMELYPILFLYAAVPLALLF